jgi:hypothetical protein
MQVIAVVIKRKLKDYEEIEVVGLLVTFIGCGAMYWSEMIYVRSIAVSSDFVLCGKEIVIVVVNFMALHSSYQLSKHALRWSRDRK